ncbi:MAG TPA: cytochrome c oxidase assembly protein [Pantanalinema sp.]
MHTDELHHQAIKAKNGKTLKLLGLVVVGMTLFAWSLVPLYRMICIKFGVGNAPQRPNLANVSAGVGDRTVIVRFVGITTAGTPATIEPLEERVVVRVGETREVKYRFKSLVDHPFDFQAVHSVTPPLEDKNFHKLECFCFTKQTLKPRETRIMPLSFWVDPAIAAKVDTITLQYTLFALKPERLSRQPG